MLAGMDISDLPERLDRVGRSKADLARYLGLDPSSLTRTIKGERRLKADELVKIEEFLAGDVSDERNVVTLHQRRKAGPARIPVYGYAAAGGDDRISFNGGQVIDWIDPPPLWNGAGDLVAIRVLGDSMEPRLFAGEMVIAQIGLPPARERDCIIELSDGSALVKTYRSQKDGHIFAQQYNPDKEIRVEATKVKALHAIIWRR